MKSLSLTDEQQQYNAQYMQIRSTKKKEYKITRVYKGRIYHLRVRCTLRNVPVSRVSFESDGGSTIMYPEHHKKATL